MCPVNARTWPSGGLCALFFFANTDNIIMCICVKREQNVEIGHCHAHPLQLYMKHYPPFLSSFWTREFMSLAFTSSAEFSLATVCQCPSVVQLFFSRDFLAWVSPQPQLSLLSSSCEWWARHPPSFVADVVRSFQGCPFSGCHGHVRKKMIYTLMKNTEHSFQVMWPRLSVFSPLDVPSTLKCGASSCI